MKLETFQYVPQIEQSEEQMEAALMSWGAAMGGE
jgi:hypothetical protein